MIIDGCLNCISANLRVRMFDSQDPVPLELTSLLQKSDNPLLHQIFTDKGTENSNSKGLSKVTVVSKFKVRCLPRMLKFENICETCLKVIGFKDAAIIKNKCVPRGVPSHDIHDAVV